MEPLVPTGSTFSSRHTEAAAAPTLTGGGDNGVFLLRTQSCELVTHWAQAICRQQFRSQNTEVPQSSCVAPDEQPEGRKRTFGAPGGAGGGFNLEAHI